jgi:hypothetical protein
VTSLNLTDPSHSFNSIPSPADLRKALFSDLTRKSSSSLPFDFNFLLHLFSFSSLLPTHVFLPIPFVLLVSTEPSAGSIPYVQNTLLHTKCLKKVPSEDCPVSEAFGSSDPGLSSSDTPLWLERSSTSARAIQILARAIQYFGSSEILPLGTAAVCRYSPLHSSHAKGSSILFSQDQ